jgi:hypothetical protein
MNFPQLTTVSAIDQAISTVENMLAEVHTKKGMIEKKIIRLEKTSTVYALRIEQAQEALRVLIEFSRDTSLDAQTQAEQQSQITEKKKALAELIAKGSGASVLEIQGRLVEFAQHETALEEWTSLLETLQTKRNQLAATTAK